MPNTTRVITKGYILNLSSNADVFARGEKYYRDGKLLSLTSADQDKDGKTPITAVVEGNYKNYDVSLVLSPDGEVHRYACSCDSHSIWRGACKHVVTALFSLMEGAAGADVSGRLQRTARELTNTLEKLIFEDIDAELVLPEAATDEAVHLSMRFHYDSRGETYLTFTVGNGRMYIIKNITAFTESVKRGETLAYGNSAALNHAPSSFDVESQKLLAFLLREESICAEAAKRIGRQYAHSIRDNQRALALTERNMDVFFDLYENAEIDGDINGSETRLTLCTGLPDIRLRVSHDGTKTTLAADPFNIRVMHGAEFHYLITPDSIRRVPKNVAMIVIHILRVLSASSESAVVFSRAEQNRFISVILPKLHKLGLVASVTGEVPNLTVSELRTRLYFDSDGHNVTGRAVFVYGEKELDALRGDDPSVLRDTAGEYAIRRRLSRLGFFADEKRGVYTLTGNELIYAFLNGNPSGIDSFKSLAEVFVTDALNKKTIRVKTPGIGIRLQGNLMDVEITNAGYTLSELMEALEAYRAKKRYHRLKDGRFLPLDGEEVASVAEMVSALDVSRKEVHGDKLTLPAYRALYVDELTRGAEAGRITRDASFDSLINDFKQNAAPQFAIPESLSGVLREYQKTGYRWLRTLSRYGFGGILADDMGLGKTLQVIAVLLSEQQPGISSLVVAPTSLLYNWENEMKRFAPSLATIVVTGLPEKRRELLSHTADVYITTYDMMKRDLEAYGDKEFAYIIADEAQNIKNASTQNARAIKALKGRTRFALTGTPIENALTELWSIFDFIMPGYLYSAHKFNRLYEYPIIRDNDAARAERLRQQIAPFVLRRIKKNVLTELPDKTETTLPAELTSEQMKIYTAYLMTAKGELDDITAKDGFASSRIRILAQLTRLRQVCCHPGLFANNYTGGSGKLDLTMETIQMAVESGHRILLFSQFTTMLDLLRNALDETCFTYFYLDGATRAQDRMDMCSRFNAGERDIFLISLKAGGTGLNLTGADVVIHYDPWWNPSVMDQASDRAHRYGQEKAVQVFNIVAKDTIEEKIMALQEQKRGLIDSVITEGGSFINALSEDEVRALFEM